MNTPQSSLFAVVPTHGAGEAFIQCIESLLNQTIPFNEIIIINNNVKDGSIFQLLNHLNITTKTETNYEIATYKNSNLKIVKLDQNTGVTGGRNEGIKNLPKNYDYVCFVDHDMIAETTMLEEMLKTIAKQEPIGIVTPKIYYWEEKNIIWSAGTDINTKTGQNIFYGGEDKGQYNTEREVAIAPAILLVKKQVIDSVGLFDSKYFAVYEDTDFCFTAKEKGYLTYYSPHAIAYHKIPYDPETAMKRLLERAYWVGRNRYIFLKKHNLISLTTILFIPIYFAYYSYLAIKYKNFPAIPQYLKGVYNGLQYK